MIRKNYQSIYHANVNLNLKEENVININAGIAINVDVSVKSVKYEEKIMFGIPLHVILKMKKI